MKNLIKTLVFLFPLFVFQNVSAQSETTAPDTLFLQDIHRPYPVGEEKAANDVFTIAVDYRDNVWIGTRAGLFQLSKGGKKWVAKMSPKNAGPVFDISIAPNGTVWVAAWNGIYHTTPSGLKKISGIQAPVSAICASSKEVLALGPDGKWIFRDGKWQVSKIPYSKTIRSILADGKGGYWIATGMGLYHPKPGGGVPVLYQDTKQLLGADVTSVATADDGSLWIGQIGGITVYKRGTRIWDFTSTNGLPNVAVKVIARGPDGKMWVGSDLGVARYDGRHWSVRMSRRWLLNDHVRDIAFDSRGTAWIATASGVSAIQPRPMTLARKFSHYYRICLARHIRTPGFIGTCVLASPGDTLHWRYDDSDNDGLHTGRYLAMQSFRYAVTKNPEAKRQAKMAFEALLKLQTITQTPGFFARSIVPVGWKKMHDPNRTFTAREWAVRRVENPRDKRVEKRWRLSKDGKYLWKGDTSSDEMTGHMFGYLFYYDLVADQREKKRVRDLVCRIMDYIVENGFVLKDIDGTHTKWAVWSPQKLNGDPDWAAERGINSLEMLSYLKLAYHVSGNKKYEKIYRNLIEKHGYAENARHAKTYNPSWRTHIDDGLLPLVYPVLFLYETDPKLRQIYQESLDWWYKSVHEDQMPLVDFVYAFCTGKPYQLDKTIFSLKDAPLDLIQWRIDNSKREDVRLVHSQDFESFQTDRLLPPSERGWDHDPWSPAMGDGGYSEKDGNWWMLAYWMGRYYGFIQAPE